MPSAQHSRKPSTRAALPRRTTKGPLDALADPLSIPVASTPSPSLLAESQPDLLPQEDLVQTVTQAQQPTAQPSGPIEEQTVEERDLSFLLDASIYHPLSQLETPGPFRRPFLPPPTSDTIAQSLEQLDPLLSRCEFLRAAQFSGSILTSGALRPTDSKTVFRLLAIRYSCLELSGNVLLAAQEAKALEDLSSSFYYEDSPSEKPGGDDAEESDAVPHHIMPFSLRLQALRLQSIGFSDPRRGVTSLYDVAFECRRHLSASSTSSDERKAWSERLHEVSIRVVNALIEMGDFDCALRTLESMKQIGHVNQALWTTRMVLLLLKMGDLAHAHTLAGSSRLSAQEKSAINSVIAIGEGDYDETAKALSDCEANVDPAVRALVRQNLAVANLYKGEVRKSRQILEELVNEGYSFQALTINLATVYDLSSDKSRDLKMSMVSDVAEQKRDTGHSRSFSNADFKL
ncbi:hypothetical protein EDD36DRAFT_186117 [Exophiala viscosa]|uniref:UBA domain-containing protein n=1 Tax=Exophiala viscosa TaxID=2486360 RepID=A0AAN6E148_9EURO|nr:hypothetical protein EDD36DRAFT_186117 [Exophiala viscosa]